MKRDLPQQISKEIRNKFSVENNTLKRDVKENPKDRITVEIGDSKQPDFKPQAKIMRWENEVNFSLRAEEHPDAVVETEGKVIKYKTPEYEVHQYELDPGDIGEDGGLEFEWVLPSKPSTNVLRATIQTKELNFYYQPPLTQKEIDEGASRPENVEGSYAVYHKTKGGMNRADGMEYKVGKAFHIYRPKVTDAEGNETWGELNIDEEQGLLSVTVDNDWLDKAVYPVVVDPTFGYTSIGASRISVYAQDGSDTSRMIGQEFVLTEAGTLDSISIGSAHGATSINFVLDSDTVDLWGGIYDKDSAGANSHALIASCESLELSISTAQFYTLNASGESLSADTYLIAGLANGADIAVSNRAIYAYADTGDTNNGTSETSTGASSYSTRKSENPWTATVDSNAYKLSIYATYTAAGGGSAPTDKFFFFFPLMPSILLFMILNNILWQQ